MTKDTRVKIIINNAWKKSPYESHTYDEWQIQVYYGLWVSGVHKRPQDRFDHYRLNPNDFLILQRSDSDPDIAFSVGQGEMTDCHFEFNNPDIGSPFMRYREMYASSPTKIAFSEHDKISNFFYGSGNDYQFHAIRLEDTDTKNWEIRFSYVG